RRLPRLLHCRPLRLLPAHSLGREPLRRAGASRDQRLRLSPPPDAKPRPRVSETGVFYQLSASFSESEDQARSKRSAFITLVHAATKSLTNFSFESEHP